MRDCEGDVPALTWLTERISACRHVLGWEREGGVCGGGGGRVYDGMVTLGR